MPDRSPLRLMLIAIAVTAVVRIAVIMTAGNAFGEDPDAYRAIAEHLRETGVFGLPAPDGTSRPTAFRPPLYPFVLSTLVTDGRLPGIGVAVLHTLLAAITAGLAFAASRRLLLRWNPDPRQASRLALVATLLLAIDPILTRQSTEIMTETPATLLAVLVMWIWGRWADPNTNSTTVLGVAMGLSLAAAYLCRPPFLVWAALMLIAMLCTSRSRSQRWAVAVAAVLVLASVAAWTYRNVRVMGHPIWATSHGGYTFLLANNESFYDYLRRGDPGVWDAEPFLDAYLHRYEGDPRTAEFWNREWTEPAKAGDAVTEYEDDALCRDAAMATIARHPGMFAWSSIVRAGRLWSPLPHETANRSGTALMVVGGFYGVLYVAVVVAAFRHRRRMLDPSLWSILLLAFALTGVHAVYWSNLRMRAPVMPGIIMLATLALVRSENQPAGDSTTGEA